VVLERSGVQHRLDGQIGICRVESPDETSRDPARALPVRRVERDPHGELRDDEWPATIPAIGQLLREGLDLSPVTVLIGENASGKSTMVEGIAGAYGMSPEGGSTGATLTT
jgi:hypothetical protein